MATKLMKGGLKQALRRRAGAVWFPWLMVDALCAQLRNESWSGRM